MPKVTLRCHPEAKPKDLTNEKKIPALADLRLRFAQNDSFAVTLTYFRHFTNSIPFRHRQA